jgi:hypothetical protein
VQPKGSQWPKSIGKGYVSIAAALPTLSLVLSVPAVGSNATSRSFKKALGRQFSVTYNL